MADPIKKITLFKVETVEQTDAAPSAATDALLTRNFKSFPVEGDLLDRPLDLPSHGARPSGFTNRRGRVTFEVEAAGSGTANVAAAYAKVLQCAGMAAPSIVVGPPAKVEQKPALPGQHSSATIHYSLDDSQRRLVGARANGWSFTAEAGQYPFFGFDFMGLIPAATPFTDAALAAPTLSAFKAPVEVNKDNATFSLDGYAAPCRRFGLTMNKERELRNLIGARTVRLGDHAVEWEALIELPLFATKNYYTKVLDRSAVALSFVNGTVAGAIIQWDLASAEINAVEEVEETGSLMTRLSGRALITAGADDCLFTTK